MCFSASASFGAGAILSVIGVASIKKSKNSSQLPFAVIPLIFSIQQITEGFLWLALSHPAYAFMQEPATYLFLFFAQIVWPVWLPFSILKLEEEGSRKTIEKILTGLGILVSAYLAYCLATYHVQAKITGYHIFYQQHYPASISYYCGACYIIATIVSCFASSVKRMWILGTAILISYVITHIFYEQYIVSVWCFFASLISVIILLIIVKIKVDKPVNRVAKISYS